VGNETFQEVGASKGRSGVRCGRGAILAYFREVMSSDLESSGSKNSPASSDSDGVVAVPKSWLKVGAIAAASAVVGGLAAAWFYRKTLSQLREAEERIPDSEYIATEDDPPEDF
jgi:hypothetical protein